MPKQYLGVEELSLYRSDDVLNRGNCTAETLKAHLVG